MGSMRETETATPEDAMKLYAIPIAPRRYALVEGPFPFSDAEWTQFLAVLTAMRPGLVANPPDPVPTEQAHAAKQATDYTPTAVARDWVEWPARDSP